MREKLYPMSKNFVTTVKLKKNVFFDYFMVDSKTRILILGDGVDSFDNMQGVLCDTDVESIVLEGKHETLTLIDGILYERIDEDNSRYDDDFFSDVNYDNNNHQIYLSKLSLRFIPPKMKIKKYVVPNDCIEFSSFSICNNNLEEVVFHNDFLYMDDMCFFDCSNLKSIHLPKSLLSIDEYPLDISGLEEITIDSDNKNYKVKGKALLNFAETELIVVPPGLRDELFEIPEGVIKAEEYLPSNSFIRKIVIPNSFSSFTDYAFCQGNSMLSSFPSLHECIIKENNPYFTLIDGVLYSKDLKKMIYYPNYKKGNEYTLIDSCISLEICAFINPIFLEKIYIPNQCFNFASIEAGISIGMDDDRDIDFYFKNGQEYDLVDFDKIYLEQFMEKYNIIDEE